MAGRRPRRGLFAEAGTPLGRDWAVDEQVFAILLHLAVRVMDEGAPDVVRMVYGGATASEVLGRPDHGETPAALPGRSCRN